MEKIIKARKKPRIYNEEEKKKFYELWKTSGMKIGEFCEHYNLTKSVFYSWRQHFDERMTAKASSLFSPVLSGFSKQATEGELKVVMMLPNDFKLNFMLQRGQLEPFIQELMHAVTVIR